MNQAVASLEHAVEPLGRDDLALFREWFSSFEAAEWDAQIERDISAGKLDPLAAEGIEEFKGRNNPQSLNPLIHHATKKFWTAYDELPVRAHGVADENFQRLKADPLLLVPE